MVVYLIQLFIIKILRGVKTIENYDKLKGN